MIPAIVGVEMARPHAVAAQFSPFVWVLSVTPGHLRSALVIHKWFDVFAGWDHEPATQDQLDTVLGLGEDSTTGRVRVHNEVAEVEKYQQVAVDVMEVTEDVLK